MTGTSHAVCSLQRRSRRQSPADERFYSQSIVPPARCFLKAPRPARACVERRAGLRIARFAVREHGVNANWQRDGRERTSPASAHRVGDATRIVELNSLVFFKARQKFFEILNRHPASSAAAGQTCEVGGVKAEFVHAGLHAWRHVARARCIRGHGQTAHGRLDGYSLRRGLLDIAPAISCFA